MSITRIMIARTSNIAHDHLSTKFNSVLAFCLVPRQMLYVNIIVFTPLNIESVSSWRNNFGFSPHFVVQMDTYIS